MVTRLAYFQGGVYDKNTFSQSRLSASASFAHRFSRKPVSIRVPYQRSPLSCAALPSQKATIAIGLCEVIEYLAAGDIFIDANLEKIIIYFIQLDFIHS
jgi:hypothetical protein